MSEPHDAAQMDAQKHDDEWADPAERRTPRDGSGKRIPQVVGLQRTGGKVKVLPMNWGDSQEKFGDGTRVDVDMAELATLFEDHIVKPDLSADSDEWAKTMPRESPTGSIQEGYVRDLAPMAVADYLQAIMEGSDIEASSVQVDASTGATVEVDENPGN